MEAPPNIGEPKPRRYGRGLWVKAARSTSWHSSPRISTSRSSTQRPGALCVG
jgi:hypothetical protein